MTVNETLDNFRRGVEAGRLAQGYVIVGPPRGEARTFVEQALQMVFCEGSPKPCGACKTCRHVAQRAHPDILWVEPEMKSRAISIDQVRDLQKLIFQTSFAGSWKACVVMAADRMAAPAANAFLKTLEEPPAKSVFFLVTDRPQSLLPTIVSRCQRLVVAGGPVRLPDEWWEPFMAVLADSSGTSAIAGFSRADRVEKILKAMKEKAKEEETEAAAKSGPDIDSDTLDARINSRYREMRTGLLQCLLRWYRDILMIVCGVDESLVHHRDCLDVLRRKAKTISYRQALSNVEMIENMNRQLEGNLPDLPVLGLGFCRLT